MIFYSHEYEGIQRGGAAWNMSLSGVHLQWKRGGRMEYEPVWGASTVKKGGGGSMEYEPVWDASTVKKGGGQHGIWACLECIYSEKRGQDGIWAACLRCIYSEKGNLSKYHKQWYNLMVMNIIIISTSVLPFLHLLLLLTLT